MTKLGAMHENLDNKIYREVKAMIVEQRLRPGTKIYQEKLAEDLGVSRTPVVNALKRLEQERLIEAIPRKGFCVRAFSPSEMIRVFELREVLEGLAARRAAQSLTGSQSQEMGGFFKGIRATDDPGDIDEYAAEDRRFHSFLIEIGGDELLSSILETYSIVASSYLVEFRGGLVRSPSETLPEHLSLIEAICTGDAAKAEELARLHFQRSRERLMEHMDAHHAGNEEGKRGP